MKKGLKKPIALLLSAMMIFSTSASAFPAMAEDNLIFEAENNSIHSDYQSEITVTTCENEKNPTETETTTVSTTNEVSVQYSDEQTENNPVEVYNSDYAVYAVSSSDEYEQPEGEGTQSSPYQISNSSQLFWFANQVNNKYGQASINAVLTADIVVNKNLLNSLEFDENGNVTNDKDFEKWSPIGNSSKQYKGTFDGQNHTISGLYFNDDSTDYVGLFGYKYYGTIKNVGVIDSYFKGEDYVGGICGSMNYGTIENSYNTGTVSGSSDVGGVCGYNYLKCKITNSYNAGSVSGSNMYAGGVCGYKSDTSTIENSYNTGSVSGNQVVGGVCGQNINIITNVYNTGTVNGNSIVGGVCGHNDGGAIENNYNTGSVSGSDKVGSICGYSYYGTIKNSYYNNSISDKTVGSNNGGTFDITGKTSEQFESGEVAFSLGGIYGQKIGKDKSPVLNGKKVYQNIICSGCCEKYQGDITYVYSNTEKNLVYLGNHNFENGICTGCRTYEPIEPDLKDGYYQIENPHHLYWFANQVNSGNKGINAVLTADIVINESVLNADGTLNSGSALTEWTPIGNFFNQYTGTFDGNNHTISGLYFNDESASSVGLFGYNDSGTIKNIGIVDSYFKGGSSVGGVCGSNGNSGTIENSYNTGSVSGSSEFVGGVCGYNSSSGTIENSYNIGPVSGSSDIGGVCGFNFSTIANSYNTGSVSGSSNVGGVCGHNVFGTIENSYYLENCNADGTKFTCYYGTAQTSEQFESGEVAYLLGGIWGQEIGKDKLPVLNGKKVYENITYSGCCEKNQGDITKCEYSNIEGTIYLENHNFENGICNYEPAQLVDGYYQIDNAGNLFWFAKQVNSGNVNINAVLTTNIVINESVLNKDRTLNSSSTPIEWTPIGNKSNRYTGIFDGNNHTISGLYFNNENINYVGLFGYNDSGTIKNVSVIDSYFKGYNYVGGVCGYNDNGGTIENSYNTGSVSGANYFVGGVCGYNNDESTIENSYNTGSVSGSSRVGGVCGGNNSSCTIKNSYNTGSVSGSENVGGVCGDNSNGKIENSYNTGSVSGSEEVGGVCGYNWNGTIENSYNTGSVNGSEEVGGVCGDNIGTITNSYNTGSVSGSSDYVGGVCGDNSNGKIENSYNTGSVSGSIDYVGGVCGDNRSGTIANSYNTGSVSGLGNIVGGVCGNNSNGKIENSYNTGSVSGSNMVGGVCGYNYSSNGKIENSYYLENCNADGTTFTNSYGITQTSEQFASGEVAYLLQDTIWGQKIGTDKLPVLNGKDKVYKVTAYSSVGNEIISEIYTNKSVTVTAPIKEGYNFDGWYTYDESNDNHYTGDILCSSREYNNSNVTADSQFVAVYTSLGTASITINCDKEYTINGVSKSSATTESYPIGSTITLSCSDESFAYWQNSAGTILSRENEYSFVVTNEETISAVFNEKVDNKVTLIFESFYGQVIATEQLGSGEIIDNPDLPIRTGYNALGWDFDGDGKFTENDTLENAIEIGLKLDSRTVKIVPVYELINETHKITVENGEGSGTYNQNDIVTATPNKAETGMKFSHWEDSDGNVLSYNEKYVFYVSKDMTVKAVYVETETNVDAKGTTGIVELNKTTNNKLSFVSMSTVPEGCKINKAGIIATDDSTIGKSNNFTDKNAKFVRGMSSDKKAVRYTWTKGNVKSGQTWYVRAYLVYTDSNGNVHTVYGDMESQTYQ